MAERKGAACRTWTETRGSRKRLRCSREEEEEEVAEILTSLRLAIVKERQLGMTKRIKHEVMCINAELDEWAARQPFIDYTCEETAAAYQAKGAALMQRLDTCDRDLQFRREAVLTAHVFLLKDVRDAAERSARAARDRLQELQTTRLALMLEGHKLGIDVLDDGVNPVRNAIVDELNEMREFRTKVAHVESREDQWGLPKMLADTLDKL